MNKLAMVFALMMATAQVSAAGIDAKKIYFGGGLGLNDANFGDSAIGFQIFAGLPLPIKAENVKLSAEVGYMDSGNFEMNLGVFGKVKTKANGLWGTAVAELPLKDNLSVLGRIGLDIGDDDGIMIGAGLGLNMNQSMDLRFEYVIRDTIDSLQVNLVIRQ
ncbi:MAG: porin family protein [Gammaproteobacteria bacterium]|nr:porin family protein [Gammaproteobacteria bacterium]